MAERMWSTALSPDVEEAITAWCQRRGVWLCVLYGSRARGTERPDSDIDIAVWERPLPPPHDRLAWLRELGDATGLTVQLVFVTPTLDPVLGMQIAREGKIVHQTGEAAWIAERVRLWQRYQDSLPFLRASRHALHEFSRRANAS